MSVAKRLVAEFVHHGDIMVNHRATIHLCITSEMCQEIVCQRVFSSNRHDRDLDLFLKIHFFGWSKYQGIEIFFAVWEQ